MSNKERGENIRRQILRDLKHHPADITKHIASVYSITPQAVSYHIKKLEHEGWLASSGTGKGKRVTLGDLRQHRAFFNLKESLAEDTLWRNDFEFIFTGLKENVAEICHYGFTEIVNNAIDHSGGESLYISVTRLENKIIIFISDDGEGIFARIKRLCALESEKQALFELSKGKLTTDPVNHTGQGIFFTSRMFDHFVIESNGHSFTHNDDSPYNIFEDSQSHNGESTVVFMGINRSSDRKMGAVFDAYDDGPEEYEFNRTIVPVRLARYGEGNLVSRSQAKRVLLHIDKFKNVVFDFNEVEVIGQAFADQIFRVYATNNPDIALTHINGTTEVNKMIARAKATLQAAQTT